MTPSAPIESLGDDPQFMTSLAPGVAVPLTFSDQKRQMTTPSQRDV